MSHKIIENSREIYIIFEGVVGVEDFTNHQLLDCLYSNKSLTIDVSGVNSVTCSDGLAGLYFLGKESPNVTLKGFSKEYENRIDKLLKL